jgi:hypothetical protein
MENIEWDKISIESLKLTFNEGEKLLKETIATADIQNKRVVTMIRPVIALIIIMVGIVVSWELTFSISNTVTVVALALLFYLFLKLSIAYRLYEVDPIGNSPSNVLRQEVIEYASVMTN